MDEKAKKEERLKELLAKRKPSNLDVDSIKAKVQAELAPMQTKRAGRAQSIRCIPTEGIS